MNKKKIFNFDTEFLKINNDISKVSEELNLNKEQSRQNRDTLKSLEKELIKLGLTREMMPSSTLSNQEINVYSEDYFTRLSTGIEKEILKEINSSTNLLPPISKLDYVMALLIGFIGSLVDILMVKIPKEINYLGKYLQEGSSFTGWLRSLGIDEDGSMNEFLAKLEKVCKVSYDVSTTDKLGDYGREVSGFYPKTHRLMSLGHDPFFGFIFGLIDIFNGSITVIDSKGIIHNIPLDKFQETPIENKIFAPLLWLGHLCSDVCTKMGLPIPGWGFTQVLQFGSLGENDRTLAELTKWMYLEGYDLRHFLSMGIVPGTIELLTKIYFRCTLSKEELASPIYAKNIKELQNHIRLEKLLFIAHSVATSGNVIKIILHQGNPLSFNMAELLGLIKQSVRIGQMSSRDKTGEIIVRNRERINSEWGKI
ncbi:hypothetical protein COK90_11565 [Priestia megaterium]|uniref:hypothetical protein n=1 Tax=Priestia megaterium TaxID=1404 RepID=UPI000BF47305|nr:hypothetical protein [Priestia megaterium]PFU61801.1 hypothetical protein COK90_11565 [Priestia megaterium]